MSSSQTTPRVREIDLPYTVMQVGDVMGAMRSTSLAFVYHLLCHLNPKSNLYPFYFHMYNTTSNIVLALAKKLTTEEQACLLVYGLRIYC